MDILLAWQFILTFDISIIWFYEKLLISSKYLNKLMKVSLVCKMFSSSECFTSCYHSLGTSQVCIWCDYRLGNGLWAPCSCISVRGWSGFGDLNRRWSSPRYLLMWEFLVAKYHMGKSPHILYIVGQKGLLATFLLLNWK